KVEKVVLLARVILVVAQRRLVGKNQRQRNMDVHTMDHVVCVDVMWPDSEDKPTLRSIFRRLTTDGVVIGLIVTNVAVFLLWRIASPQFMVKNFMISVDNFTSGRLHTLITSAFSHRDSWHLSSNMVGLYFFGSSIGRTFGPEYLLKLYLSGAVVGSIFYLAYHAFIAPSFQRTQMGIHPSKVPGLVGIPNPLGIFMVGKDVLRILEGDHEVSGSAHLGGATVAALAWAQSRKGRFRRF
ncbi:UNVERIFIED_CONTAM: RHOMBOID-like protein 12, mitochondrial, partial [Sesamum calycinum]